MKTIEKVNFLSFLHCKILPIFLTSYFPYFSGIIPRAIVHIFEGKEADEDQVCIILTESEVNAYFLDCSKVKNHLLTFELLSRLQKSV